MVYSEVHLTGLQNEIIPIIIFFISSFTFTGNRTSHENFVSEILPLEILFIKTIKKTLKNAVNLTSNIFCYPRVIKCTNNASKFSKKFSPLFL